jgi:hypothetical protein
MGIMVSYPIEIRRCGHIKTNGTQCGSPALKGKELCYFHEKNRPEPVDYYIDEEHYSVGQIVLPVFEDGHSIQTVIRQVVQLMLTRRIERKDAGLMLYALQIAAGNLKTMQTEKARPTQMVVEPEKAGETPMGMTPWSASGQGHDPEEEEEEEVWAPQGAVPPPTADELYAGVTVGERTMIREKWSEEGMLDPQELEDYLLHDGHDPFLLTMRRICAERDSELRAEAR